MKLLISCLLLAAVAQANPAGMDDEFMGLVMAKMAPIISKLWEMKFRAKEMMPKVDLQQMLSAKLCFGSDTDFTNKMNEAFDACRPECEMMGEEIDNEMMEKLIMGDLLGEMVAKMQDMMMGGGDMMPAGRSMAKMAKMAKMGKMMKDPKMMIMMVFQKSMETRKCVLTEMGWFDESCEVQRCAVQGDIMSTVFADEVSDVEMMCHASSRAITPECIDAMMSGEFDDMTPEEFMAMVQEKAGQMEMEDPMCDADQGAARGMRGPRRGGRGGESSEEELTADQMAMLEGIVLQSVQNMVYFDCIHCSLKAKCCENVQEAVMEVIDPAGK